MCLRHYVSYFAYSLNLQNPVVRYYLHSWNRKQVQRVSDLFRSVQLLNADPYLHWFLCLQAQEYLFPHAFSFEKELTGNMVKHPIPSPGNFDYYKKFFIIIESKSTGITESHPKKLSVEK